MRLQLRVPKAAELYVTEAAELHVTEGVLPIQGDDIIPAAAGIVHSFSSDDFVRARAGSTASQQLSSGVLPIDDVSDDCISDD